MIFVTVGTELPFDRLMRVVDKWAGDTGRTDIFAQIGQTDWHPEHVRYARFLEPDEFARQFAAATAIVAHAGMGTILSALRSRKPILVMPRRAAFGEQRNDHQLATARRLSVAGKVKVAFDEATLRSELDRVEMLDAQSVIGEFASEELISGIRRFILHEPSQLIARRGQGRFLD